MTACPCQGCPQAPGGDGRESSSFLAGIERFPPFSVNDAGTRSPDLVIGDDAGRRAAGWELSILVTLAAQDRLLGRLTGIAYAQTAQSFLFDAWDCNRGGRVFVPFPVARLSFISALSPAVPGNHTVSVSAMPWYPGHPILGQRTLYGRSLVSLGAGATVSTSVPTGATHYRVGPNSGLTARIGIEEAATPSGGSEQAWDAYDLDPTAAAPPHGDAPEAWHRVPPPLGTTIIRIVNRDGVNARKVAIQWRYDLDGVL